MKEREGNAHSKGGVKSEKREIIIGKTRAKPHSGVGKKQSGSLKLRPEVITVAWSQKHGMMRKSRARRG